MTKRFVTDRPSRLPELPPRAIIFLGHMGEHNPSAADKPAAWAWGHHWQAHTPCFAAEHDSRTWVATPPDQLVPLLMVSCAAVIGLFATAG